jgi:hypothetical protein
MKSRGKRLSKQQTARGKFKILGSQAILMFVVVCFLSEFMLMGVSGQVLLVNDTTVKGNGSDIGDYEFSVLSENPAVIGVRSLSVNGFDIETYKDTTYKDLIEGSQSAGDAVNFVVLDGDSGTRPSNIGTQVSSNSGDYIIEMENEIDKHPAGVSWVGSMDRPEGGPVLNLGFPGDLDDEGVYGPTVVFDGEKYHMWYTIFDGSNECIVYASSSDGIQWKKNSDPVLEPSVEWEAEGVSHPSVLYKNGDYHMWYTGDDGTTTAIGYATSKDGIKWLRDNRNPMVKVPKGSLDGSGVSQPSVIYVDQCYHMWYAFFDGSNYNIEYTFS